MSIGVLALVRLSPERLAALTGAGYAVREGPTYPSRTDAIRDAGWQVVRWTWAELATPEVIVERILRALARARRSESPTGRVVRMPRIG